jgi:chromosome partitioning protein
MYNRCLLRVCMKSIAVHLQKGGVGKTSLSGALAFELSKKGRTILIDVDPQGNSSSWHLTATPEHELADVLDGTIIASEAIVSTGIPNFDMLPTFGLDGSLKAYGENKLANEPFIFQDLRDELIRLGYDYAVYDLSPGMGRLEKSALLAVGEVITPIIPEYFSLDGLETFAFELDRLKKALRYAPEHKIVIVNAFDARIAQHRSVSAQADEIRGKQVYRIPVDPAIRKAQAAHIPIQNLPREEAPKPETIVSLSSIVEAIA